MKNKPQRHKETNVFKYKSFGDRVTQIDLRHTALYHIHHVNEETTPEENETFFRQAYGKWIVLNLSEEYNRFQRQIRDIVTLPQLIHKKDFVIDLLLNSLEKGTTLALQPLLEFVVVLAKDLREEFYPYFQQFLNRLIQLLRTQDADQLEWTLICLAYLFKTLKPFLKKDITVVFNAIIPLLDYRNPEHIINFAAECFSFVTRDIRERDKFLSLILVALKKHKNGVAGCGRLLFEIMRGVNGLLHSCAADFLMILLKSLTKHDLYDLDLLNDVLHSCILNLLHSTNPKGMQIFWEVSNRCLLETLSSIKMVVENGTTTAIDVDDNDDTANEENERQNLAIRRQLSLMGQAIEFRNGKLICSPETLISSLIEIIDNNNINESTILIVSQMISVLLQLPTLSITQLDASRITRKILHAPYRPVFETFVWNIVKYSQFDILILPDFIRFVEANIKDSDVLELLTKIILEKSPLNKNGINLSNHTIYPLRFKKLETIKEFEMIINNRNENDSTDDENVLMSFIIYPHILANRPSEIKLKTKSIINELIDKLEKTTINHAQRNLLFSLSIIIESIIQMKQINWLDSLILIPKLLKLYEKYQLNQTIILNIIDLLISSMPKELLTLELFKLVHESLAQNLSSPYHHVRLVISHLLMQFVDNLNGTSDDADDKNIYRIFYNVESITASVQTYRDQLLYLQKLEPDLELFRGIKGSFKAKDPLRYLLGALYMNFNLLWKPITNLISNYCQSLEIVEFWPLLKNRIDETTTAIRKPIQTIEPSVGFDTTNTCLLDQYCSVYTEIDRPDHQNYRILLWRLVPECGHLRDIKNRDIISMLFDFIDLEYRKSHENDSLCWNLLEKKDDYDCDDDDNDDDDEKNDDDVDDAKVNDDGKSVTKKKNKKSNEMHKGTQRTLIAIVSVFVKIENPSQVYRQTELYELFLEFLTHRNPYIQKLALDCIMSYKHKYLLPYKDHLYGIIDEKRFKDAITGFKITGTENMIEPEHRTNLMTILLRILYSKLIAKVQKGGGQMRKSLVMRFLGCCERTEIEQLLRMAFRVYENMSTPDEPMQLVNFVIESQNLNNILSPKKLQSSLNLIEIIREQFGGLIGPEIHKYLLKIILIIGSIIEGVFRRQQENNNLNIIVSYGKLLKNIRGICTQSLSNFFNHFDTYPWQTNEIDAIFTLFITPILSKLPRDGIHSATPLLKLFSTFSKNSRYFIFFTKQSVVATASSNDKNDEDCTPLRYIMDLLLEPQTKPLVCLAIMEQIENLLQLKDIEIDEEEQNDGNNEIKSIIINNMRQPPARPKSLELINFGSVILLPYMGRILEKFQLNLKKRRGLTKRDLLIISRCTELVTDSETAGTLLDVLLPILIRKTHANASEDALSQMVKTIKNLFEKVDNPEQYIRSIAPMFEQITAVGPRKLLSDLIYAIAKRTDGGKRKDLHQLSEIVKELNAWDKRWIEQPDYEKRLSAYKKIEQLRETNQLDMNIGLLTIYHSFYFIKFDKDMAMRDTASHHLQLLIPALAKKFANNSKELDYLFGTVLLNLIRRTLNDKNEQFRSEGITLLGEMARECPEAHPCLQDLNELTNRQDRETDFFDNMIHLQVHRHGRGLQRFCTIAKKLDKMPQTRTLTQFILPMATRYLLNDKHAEKHAVIQLAIETIGMVCRFLPWHQYETLLKYYLKKMRFTVEYQKQCVRLVMQILDSFHFDLSQANVMKKDIEIVAKEVEQKLTEIENQKMINEKKVIDADDKNVEDGDDGEEIVLGTDETIADGEDLLDLDDSKDANDDDDDDPKEIFEQPTKKIKIAIYDKPILLSQKAAKRLVHTIASGLIPQLNNSITVISTYDNFHKVNKKKRKSEREEEEMLRVPIALAMVKLLQKLPEGVLDHSLPGILIKVCLFLKSPLKSVRMVTRDVLKNIMLTVGAKYLDTLLHQMTTLLTRGFQVHVLTVTVYSILDALKHQFKLGDIDRNMQSILSVCLEDIFGKTAEEKEVKKIGMSTPEAKPSNKSYLTLHIIAININETCLLDLLIPFKDQLTKTQSKQTVLKVQECFQKIVMGLVLNKHISIQSLLMFIYGTASESIPDLLPGVPRPVLTEQEKDKMQRARPDCFLIQEAPRGRTGAIRKVIKTNVRANAHVLVEFGLDMLHIILKRGKLLKIDYKPFLDPIVPVLLDSLKSAHIRVTTYALKCLTSLWNREMELSNLEKYINNIVPEIFAILHKYATAGMSTSNENFSLVKNAFKGMTSLMRNVSYYTVNEEELKTLLLYVEQNLFDNNKQTIAFSLLKVIIGRKLLVNEIHDVMRKISEIVIVSESSVSRVDAKNLMVNYLMDYPLGKKVDGYLKFFTTNLTYELPMGRESAIQLIQAIVKRFPQEVLHKKGGILFLSLGARLVNDESPDCRRLVAECIENLLQKLDKTNRNELFDILLVLLADNKPSHREMSAILCNRFIIVEKDKFIERIDKLLPLLIGTLSVGKKGPGQFVRIIPASQTNLINEDDGEPENRSDDDDYDEEQLARKAEQIQRAKDHQLIQVTNTILKILETFPETIDKEFNHFVDEIAYESQKLLAYEHVWVRLNAARTLETILRKINVNRLQSLLLGENVTTAGEETNCMDFLYLNPRQELKSLCLDLCAQMVPEVTDPEMAELVMKNLLYIANIIQVVPLEKQQQQSNDNDLDVEKKQTDEIIDQGERPINLTWLIRRMRYVIHAEVDKAPHRTVLRTATFRWIEGLAELLPEEITSNLSYVLLRPLVREMSEEDKNIDSKLRQLAIKVGNSIKKKIGDDSYNLLRSQLQTKLMIKRAARKKTLAQEKVNNPVGAAKRKEHERERKKVAKKRKLDVIKGRALPKKKRIKRTANEEDDDFF